MREDTFTSTEADAASYERYRADGYSYEDEPTPDETASGCCPDPATAALKLCGCYS